MGEKSPIERFYDAASGQYLQKKLRMVSARLARQIILDTVRDLPLGDGSWQVLDAGGGGGLYAAEMAKLGHQVCIVDVSAGMLRLASKHLAEAGLTGRVRLVKGDVCDLRVLDGRPFDLVLAVGDVLSYCSDARKALTEFGRLTRPGGMLLLEVESRFGAIRSGRRGRTLEEVYGTLLRGRASPPDGPDVRIRLFEPAEVRLLLQETGWRVVHQWPGAICWALLGARALQEFGRTQEGYARLLEMERRLRKIPELQAAGGDLQLLASR
jgi:ubiquinone/menaquinone biosynthesis C-methylase UbiE